MFKTATIILACLLLTTAIYNIGAATYANRVVARVVHVVPEKTTDSCVVYKMDGTMVIVIDEKKTKARVKK